MNLNRDLARIIIHLTEEELKEIESLLPLDEMTVAKEPSKGLVMFTALDSFDTEFYLGEVLVTEASVRYKDQEGYAMIMGDEPERALIMACVDALTRTKDEDELKKRVTEFLENKLSRLEEEIEREKRLVWATKVNFESMAKR